MARKKIEYKDVKYYLPDGVKERIDTIVDSSNYYKIKHLWKQKFYFIADYITTQNFEQKIDTTKVYVNVHQETMANILGVDNKQIATILKDCVNSGLFKKDGIWQAAVFSGSGKNKSVIVTGKSYGYQFIEWNVLKEINITDNRNSDKKFRMNSWKKAGKNISNLPEYLTTLSVIKIDETNFEETLKEILLNKEMKKHQKYNYDNFIKIYESNVIQRKQIKNNSKCVYIPFDGVIVPAKNTENSKAAYSYFNNLQGGVIVPCYQCKIEVVRFTGTFEVVKDNSYEEPVQTTIERCKRALYIINNGLMVPTRPQAESRVYCEITHLNREFRKDIRLDGKKIIGLDIANSQPLIASILIKNYWSKKGNYIPDDVHQYQNACEAGIFYDEFIEIVGLLKELRSQFKVDFFSKVFFSKVIEKNNILKDLFIEKYPSCWEAICDWKGGLYSNDYNRFAILLQALEASIIFDDVNMGLIKRGIKAFNIFDSIYVNNIQDLEIAKQLTIKAFKNFGVNPTFKFEYLEHGIDDTQHKSIQNDHSGVSGTQILNLENK